MDVSQIICDLNLRPDAVDSAAAAKSGLQAIEHEAILVIYSGSNDYEHLVTKHGKISLDGHIGRWMLRGKPVALNTLWERYPDLRPYLRSRTENFIARARQDLDWIKSDEAGFLTRVIENLVSELELLSDDTE